MADLDHMKEVMAEHWGDLTGMMFEDIAAKYLGDKDTFFACAESVDMIANSREEDIDIARKIMSLLAGLVKVAYDHGKAMATQ